MLSFLSLNWLEHKKRFSFSKCSCKVLDFLKGKTVFIFIYSKAVAYSKSQLFEGCGLLFLEYYELDKKNQKIEQFVFLIEL